MKKTALISIVAIISIAILAQSGMFESLMLLLLVGAVPGTPYSIPPNAMLLVVIASAWLIVFKLAFAEIATLRVQKRALKKRTERKKRMPVQRFSEI